MAYSNKVDALEAKRKILARKKALRHLIEHNNDLSEYLVEYINSTGFFTCGYDSDINKQVYLNGVRHAVLLLLDGLGYGGDEVLKFNKMLGGNNEY